MSVPHTSAYILLARKLLARKWSPFHSLLFLLLTNRDVMLGSLAALTDYEVSICKAEDNRMERKEPRSL